MTSENEIGTAIIGAAIEIHSLVGPGLLESAYEACLVYELEKLGLSIQRQSALPLRYKDLALDIAYRADLIVQNLVVVELKTVGGILPVHRSQLLSYLRLGGFKLGCLLNFPVAQMRDGIVRMANGL
ncbi:MAG: GxxExxY protein [Stellaceae bacterium]